jgi:hypothetical protein
MAKRVMIACDLNKRRKLLPANLLGTLAAWRERASLWQVRQVRGLAGYLIELSLFRGGIGD